jgi:hypothetical protein
MRWVLAKCFAQSPTQAHFFSLMETKHLEEQAGTSRVLGLHQESQGGMTMSQLPVDRVVGLDQESKGDTKRSQQPLGQAQAVNVRAGCRENKGDSKRPRCREDDDPPLDSAFKARMFEIDTEEIRVRQAYKDTFKGKDLPFDLHVIPDLNRFLGSTWINVFGSPGLSGFTSTHSRSKAGEPVPFMASESVRFPMLTCSWDSVRARLTLIKSGHTFVSNIRT